MRADVPLFASLLAATAAASNITAPANTTTIDNSYSNGAYGNKDNSNTNDKIVAELEAEVEALRHQLESAKQETCDVPANPVTGGSGSSPSKPAGSDGDKETTPAESSDDESKPEQPASYDSGKQSGDESSPAAPATTQAPAYNGEGSNKGSPKNEGDKQKKSKDEGNYYAPNAPSSDAKSTSTVTVIVSAGEDETKTLTQTRTQTLTRTAAGASETADSDVEIETRTETYCGKGPIPTAPSGDNSGSGSDNNAGKASSALSSVFNSGNPSHSSSALDISSVISSTRGYFSNGTTTAHGSGFQTSTRGASDLPLTSSDSVPSGTGVNPASSSATVPTGTGAIGTGVSSSTTSSASATATASLSECESFCETLTTFNGWDVTPLTCTQREAGVQYDTPTGQSSVSCAKTFTPEVDLCQVTLNIKTSGTAETYAEVWLPNSDASAWNGRSMNTDNGGLNGCIHYVDMEYVTGLGFAAIGDNAGHNGSSFDGTWTMNNNEAIIDWSYRARHAAVEVGKETIDQFYSKPADYSYYVGCSAGGAQGIQSAEMFPEDFDGIISGAAANDFNHLQGWSATFRTITGTSGNDTFLTLAEWTLVQSYVLEQCDEALDGVADGIIEDPTICNFDASAIPVCSGDSSDNCLTATQIQTVEDVFKPLYNQAGDLIYPALLPGSQVDAVNLGLLSGSVQGIAQDWFRGAVFNDSSYDITQITAQDIDLNQELDELHGYPSAFSADLAGFREAGKKLMIYHGMADPMTSGGNAQRYYLKAADRLGLDNTQLDEFMRLFRISGMAHCGVGGISGAGAWQFGQNGAAAQATNNIVSNLVDWVENDAAPETLKGTKFWWDTPSSGIMFERDHCRFPYRTTYQGGDSTLAESWGCEFIENWRDCADQFCSEDGTFT